MGEDMGKTSSSSPGVKPPLGETPSQPAVSAASQTDTPPEAEGISHSANGEASSSGDMRGHPRTPLAQSLGVWLILGFFLLVMISLALLIISFKPAPQTIHYGLYAFTPGPDGFYHLAYEHPITGREYDIPLRYLPQNLTRIPTTGWLSGLPEPFYIAVDVNTTDGEELGYMQLAAADLARKLKNLYNPSMRVACTPNSQADPACTDRPVYTCNGTMPGVAFHLASAPRLDLQGICANVYGTRESLLMAEEKLVYILLGVIKE